MELNQRSIMVPIHRDGIKEIDTSRSFTLHNFSSWLLKFDVWNYEYDYYLKAMKHKMVSAAILYYLVLLMTL